MGFWDKLKFWKHEELPAFEPGRYPGLESGSLPESFAPPAGPELGMHEDIGPAPLPPVRPQLAPVPAPGAFAQPIQQADAQRDFQVVNAKLDTLKALLDNINAKLDRLERAQQAEESVPLAVRRWK